MNKNILISAALVAASVCGAAAQNTLYLVKDGHVVSKYNVDDVDYATFRLPDDVIDAPLWVNIDSKSKNSITYTVKTTQSGTQYVHAPMSIHFLDYWAMTNTGNMWEALNDAERAALVKEILPYADCFVGKDETKMTVSDFMDLGYYHMSLMPGTEHYIVAWPIDPVTQELTGDEYAFEPVSTDAPGQGSGTFNLSFKRMNDEGVAFNFDCSDDIVYFRTLYGVKSVMENAIAFYGEDATFGMFGEIYSVENLHGTGEMGEGIENATWPAYEDGEYILMARAYDANGDVISTSCTVEVTAQRDAGPMVNIFTRSKGEGTVSVNFEITPSNVDEAYVRLMGENDCDDRLNMGYEYYELAMGGDATDITTDIRTMGEYTFSAQNLEEKWYTILIYAKNSDGRTTQRMSFFPTADEDIQWSDYEPKHSRSQKPIAKVGKGNAKTANGFFNRK